MNSVWLYSLLLFFNLCIFDSNESQEERSILNRGIGTREFLNDLQNYINSQQHSNISENILIQDINVFIKDECGYLSQLQLDYSEYLTGRFVPMYFNISNGNINETIEIVNAFTSRALFILFINDSMTGIEKDVLTKTYTSFELFDKIAGEFLKFRAENIILKISDLRFAAVQHHILHILFKHQFDCIKKNLTDEESKLKIHEMFNKIRKYILTKHIVYRTKTIIFYSEENFFKNNLAILELELLRTLKTTLTVRRRQSPMQRNMINRKCVEIITNYIIQNAKSFLKTYFKKKGYFSSEFQNIINESLDKEEIDYPLNIENKIINLLLKKISKRLPRNEEKRISLQFIWNYDESGSTCAESNT